MGCMYHRIKVNDHVQSLPLAIEIGLYSPHPSVKIWLLINLGEPVYKYTRVSLAIVFEQEDKFDSGNVEAPHSWYIRISDGKGSIIMGNMKFPHHNVACMCSLAMPWIPQTSLGA